MMTPRLSRRRLVPWSFAVAAVMGSCNLHNPGVSPPSAVLSFPSALALSREPMPRLLYVANSNFDLRYNAGSLQSYNLDALDRVLASNRCRSYGKLPAGDAGSRPFDDNTNYGMLGLLDAGPSDAGADDAGGLVLADDAGGLVLADAGSLDAGKGRVGAPIVLPGDYDLTSKYGNAQGFLCDGRDPAGYEGCCIDTGPELDAIRQSSFEIDSFAVGVAVSPSNDRVYVPVSSRNQLLYFDVVNDQLACGDETTRCRRGPGLKSADHVPYDNFPGSLSAMTVGTLSDLIPPAAANGLVLDATYVATTHDLGGFGLFVEERDSAGTSSAPILDGVLRNLGQRPRSVLADPVRHVLYVASAGESYISRIALRVNPTVPGELGLRATPYESSRIAVSGVSQAGDLRDMTFDPNNHDRLYVLIRGTQESVGFLDLDPTLKTNARLVDSVRIGAGPSKLALMVQDGRTFLLVTCYDSKSIYIIDAAERALVAVVRSLSGPFTMAYDTSRKLLHVADFRSSVLRVVDLKGLTDRSEPPPRIVATIGSPQFEGALQ